MKLRIKGNSVRLRLTQGEVARFAEVGLVEEVTEFGAGQKLIYALVRSDSEENICAEFAVGKLRVIVPAPQADQWANSSQVGVEVEQETDNGNKLKILIEKDFTCLAPRSGEDDADAYPHPPVD
jgi:hypothetical protein